MLGEFKDGNNDEDYTYDQSGNLTKDLNKGLHNAGTDGIIYNIFNKPVKMVLHNKSVVEYTYSATGERLSKKVTKQGTTNAITTNYIGDFVYEEMNLQYLLHEEGRVKVITPISTSRRELNAGTGGILLPGGKQGALEYFIKDHLSNIRMVLTEEVQQEWYRATMEYSAAEDEEPIFGKVGTDGIIAADNELRHTRVQNSDPVTSAWPNHVNDFVKLTAAETGKQLGPNILLKVMAGDLVKTTAKYYYRLNDPTGGTNNSINTVVSSLINALVNPTSSMVTGKNFISEINSGLNSDLAFNNFLTTTQPTTGNINAPKAYINVVFLDEQFQFIEKDLTTPDIGTSFERVSQNDNPNAAFSVLQQKAPKNGWVYVYLSNESNEPVYFDDFYVAHEHGRIVQESHYYPFGLKIAALSSKAFNKLDAKYGYQGDYSEEEIETGYNEFALRHYDPQIGRWTSVDPYDQFASPYVGMGNDPINHVDPDGGFSGTNGAVFGSLGGFLLGTAVAKLSGADWDEALAWGAAGAFMGGGIGYGWGQSMTENTGFFLNLRAFYDGLLLGGGRDNWVDAKFDALNRGPAGIETPNIWVGFGSIFRGSRSEELIPNTPGFTRGIRNIPVTDRSITGLPNIVLNPNIILRPIVINRTQVHVPPVPSPPAPRTINLNRGRVYNGAFSVMDATPSIEQIQSVENFINQIRQQMINNGCNSIDITSIRVSLTFPSNSPLGSSVVRSGAFSYYIGNQRTDNPTGSGITLRPITGVGNTPIQNLQSQALRMGRRIAQRFNSGQQFIQQPEIQIGSRYSIRISITATCQ